MDEKVVIIADKETTETEAKSFSLDEAKEGGFTPEEIEMGVKQGIIKDAPKEEKKEDKKAEKTEPEKKEEVKKELKETDEDDPEHEYESIKDYNANEKALYFRQKKERQKRQKAESERDYIKAQILARDKEIAELRIKNTPEPEIDPEDAERYVTVADMKKKEAEEAKQREEEHKQEVAARSEAVRIKDRLAEQERTAKAKDENFDKICDLAKEIMEKQKSGLYAKELAMLAADEDADVTGFIYEVAQLHPEYQTVKNGKSETAKTEGKNNVDKIVKNAQKRQSSAAVGGGGSRTVAVDDLTIGDVKDMSQAQWDKLPKEVRERLLKS